MTYKILVCSRCGVQLDENGPGGSEDPGHPRPFCWEYSDGLANRDGGLLFDVEEIEVVRADKPEDPRIAAAEYERDHPMDDPGEADHAALREFGP